MMVQQEKEESSLARQITIEQIQSKLDEVKSMMPALFETKQMIDAKSEQVQSEIMNYALSLKLAKLDPSYLEAFFKKPYVIVPVPRRADTWRFFIPRMLPVQIGYFESQTESYNCFIVNRYTDWFGEIPDIIKKELKFETPLELKIRGDEMFGPAADLEKGYQKYREFIVSKDKDRLKINPKRAFELIASMIKDQILPFTPNLIDKNDLVERKCDFELRDYQKQAWQRLEQYSNIGVFYPPGTGKTIIGLYALTHLKPPHLIAVPTQMLKEQWLDRIQAHTDLQPNEYMVETYQSAIKKASDKQWTLKFIDECQHLPADYIVKLSLIPSRYIIGASATPQREDERENYIFALTGYPVGLSWQYFRDLKLIKNPTCDVWLVKTPSEKISKLKQLLFDDKKTVVFCDGIDFGTTISKAINAPFVYGDTKKGRFETVKNSPVVVVSRVGEEGMSLPNLQRVIEVDWLFGSRRQEAQRFGRLLHAHEVAGEGEHHILMTLDEFARDRKRLFGIMDKGFKVDIHREGVSEKTIERISESPRQRRSFTPRRIASPSPIESAQPPSAEVDAIYQKIGLPRAPKFRASMNRGQQKIFDYLIQNDGNFYKKDKLALMLEVSVDYLNHILPDMVRKGWIEQKKEEKEMAYGTMMKAKIS